MQRPDKKIINRVFNEAKKIKQGKNYLTNLIDIALDLPLISLTDHFFVEGPIAEWLVQTAGLRHEELQAYAEPVFDEFVLHYKDKILLHTNNHNELVECHLWGCFLDSSSLPNDPFVKSQKNGKFLNLWVSYADKPKILHLWQGWVTITVNEKKQFVAYVSPTPGCKDLWGDALKGMNDLAKAITERSQLIWYYAKYGDKHIVEVVPTKPKAPKKSALHKNRPWTTASGPHILFLDRMPTTQKEGTGTHASPKPHRRRGHWKTLNHPRFRHHPQYQQKIYVKPSFVGPRQTTYEGNIYRLVQPLEDSAGMQSFTGTIPEKKKNDQETHPR